MSEQDRLVVLVDGYCSLCKGWTYFVASRDTADMLRFASQQSTVGQILLDSGDVSDESVVVYKDGQYLVRSDAVLAVLHVLPFPWFLASVGWVVPRFLRDWVYDVVASHRHQWFGREDNDFCAVDDSELDDKLLRD